MIRLRPCSRETSCRARCNRLSGAPGRLRSEKGALNSSARPIAVRILQGVDVILTKVLPEEELAVTWVRLYGERLKRQGWFETPV